MNNLLAFLIIAVLYFIGEAISTKAKAWIPSVFIIACFFLVGYWTFFPEDIVQLAGLGPPLGGAVAVMLCITHMGTIISIKQLLQQWKVIVITLSGLAGMMIFCWFISRPIVGREFVVAGLPPLTGGIVAATIMSEAALEKGLITASILAIAMYCMQGFAGYPLTTIMLKIEGKRLLQEYRVSGKKLATTAGDIDEDAGNLEQEEEERRKLIPKLPEKYYTTSFILAKLAIVAYISHLLGRFSGLNQAVWALIMGIIFTEIGFLDKDSLNKAKSYGFIMYVLMVYIFSGLKDATPELILEVLGPMVFIIVVGVAGLGLFSIIAGRILKISWNMAFAVSLTALYGFPPNYIITDECSKSLAANKEEYDYLMGKMLPMMIVGGFTTVTITSVIIAGIFANMF